MLAATACHSPNTQMPLGGCSPGMEVSHSSANSLNPFGSFANIAFESCESEIGDDTKINGVKDPFADYEFIPNITVSAETNSCSELPPSRYSDFGTPQDSMFLSNTMNTSGKENDLDDSKLSAMDTIIDYHRRLSVSMEEINLSHESRDEGKSPTVVEKIKHSHHNYNKSNMNISPVPVNETADKTTMKSSLYSTLAAIEEMMVSPLKSFHEKVRKKLKKMSTPILQQRYDVFQESPTSVGSPAVGQESKTSNSDSVDEEEEMVLPTGPRREGDDSNALNNTFIFIDEVSNEPNSPDRLWKREDEIYGCSVTGAINDQLVTPRTPWHSPIRDLRSPAGHEQEGLPNISWSSPTVSEIFCSPEPTNSFGKRSRFLCRIYVPAWLVWRPKLFAFVCEFEREAGLNSCVDLLLEEPNPEEHWHVVRPKDITPPEVGEERVIHVPRGMVWVRTSRSGFLTTKARLRDIAQRRPLPCTWRAVTGKSKLVRVLNPRERYVNI